MLCLVLCVAVAVAVAVVVVVVCVAPPLLHASRVPLTPHAQRRPPPRSSSRILRLLLHSVFWFPLAA